MAELKPYNPTWKDRLAQMLMDTGSGRPSPTKRRFIEGALGSSGLGSTGLGLVDATGLGQLLDAQENVAKGDYQGAAVAIMPGGQRASKAGKASAKALGEALLDNRTYWSDLSKTKLRVPLEEMNATRVPTGELAPRRVISPEDLQGSILTPAVGDRTMAGHRLTAINGQDLANPVSLEGGPDFMRSAANAADGAVWASDKGVITRLGNLARELGESGKDVNFVYSGMGARSGDYSHMMGDALLAQMPAAEVTRANRAAFDEALRARFPDWPGVDDPRAREMLLRSGPLRKTFVEEMALGKHQDAGFPDVGSTRFAISDPNLVHEPTGASGYAISRLDPSGRIITDPTVPHTTYNTQLGGQGYLGGFEQSVPREVMFPEFYRQRRAMGAPELADDRAFTMSNVSQPADQQWLDGVMNYLEQARSAGSGR